MAAPTLTLEQFSKDNNIVFTSLNPPASSNTYLAKYVNWLRSDSTGFVQRTEKAFCRMINLFISFIPVLNFISHKISREWGRQETAQVDSKKDLENLFTAFTTNWISRTQYDQVRQEKTEVTKTAAKVKEDHEKAIKGHLATAAQLQKEKTILETTIKDLTGKIENSDKLLQAARARTTQLQADLDQSTLLPKDVQSAQKELIAEKEKAEKLQKELENAKQSYEQNLNTVQLQVNNQHTQIQQYMTDIQKHEEDIKSLAATNKQVVDDLTKKNEELTNKLNSNQVPNASLESQNNELLQKIAQLELKVKEQQSALDLSKNAAKKEVKDLRKTNSQYEKEIQGLRSQLKPVKKDDTTTSTEARPTSPKPTKQTEDLNQSPQVNFLGVSSPVKTEIGSPTSELPQTPDSLLVIKAKDDLEPLPSPTKEGENK